MPFYPVNLSTCYDRLPGVGERRLEASPASVLGCGLGRTEISLRNLEVISAGDAGETQGSLLSFTLVISLGLVLGSGEGEET